MLTSQEELENRSNVRYEQLMWLSNPRSHWAAIVIQRAYRAYRHRNKFRDLKSLDTLDALILQAAGLGLSSSRRPAERRIRRPQDPPLRRSRSLKNPERKSVFEEDRSKDELYLLGALPPPPRMFLDPPQTLEDEGTFENDDDEDIDDLPLPPPPLVPENDFPTPHESHHHDEEDDLPLPPPPFQPPILPAAHRGSTASSTSSSISSVDSGFPATPPPPPLSTSTNFIPMMSTSIMTKSPPKKAVRISESSFACSPILRPPTDDSLRKRQYRVGLNLFNQNPERGMEYLIRKNYVEYSPSAVARFLLRRKGISKKTLGDYLSTLGRPFNMAVLHCFVHEVDLTGLHIDIALRRLQEEVMLPGESQKIEKIIEVFSKRYIQCNSLFVSSFSSPADTIFVLTYAMVLLNTDLHSKAVGRSSSRRMKKEDFIRNLRGLDGGRDLDEDMLRGIFDRIRGEPFLPGPDHSSQVLKVESSIRGEFDKAVGGRLSEPHRRLVCFCRLSEVRPQIPKKSSFPRLSGSDSSPHQRGVFLFNDLLLVTKGLAKKKTLHQYRYSVSLRDLRVHTFSSGFCPHGIQIQDRFSGKVISTFDAKSESDQARFVHDLQESISETIEMDRARLYFDDVEDEEML